RSTATHGHLLHDRERRGKMRRYLARGMTDPARILLGHDERDAEEPCAAQQECGGRDHALPRMKRRPVAFLEIDQDERGLRAVEQIRMSHGAFLLTATRAGNACFTGSRVPG